MSVRGTLMVSACRTFWLWMARDSDGERDLSHGVLPYIPLSWQRDIVAWARMGVSRTG